MTLRYNKAILSASIMCADILCMADILRDAEAAGIDYIHCDIMDNHFVPNLMLPPYQINRFRKATDLPFDIHIMAENPLTIINKLDLRKNDIVFVHYECADDLYLISQQLHNLGVKMGVAFFPKTKIDSITDILDFIDSILLLLVEPGFSGQKMLPDSIDRIKQLNSILINEGYPNITIEVDGNCSYNNILSMQLSGAKAFVLGSSSLFVANQSLREGIEKVNIILDKKS